MQCIGITKGKMRCRNSAKLVFCNKHVWQPFSAVVTIFLIVEFFGGFFQDIVKPLLEKLDRDTELRKAVAVEIKNNRRTVAAFENNLNPTNGKSDVVTILLGRQPVKSLEIYHTAKDQRFKDYPPTAALADFFIPTVAEYQVVDLDGDGVNEIVIILTNQIYSLHYDKQVNVLIYNPVGELLARTPYPQDILELKLDIHNPYSAYKTTVTMKDEVTGLTQNSTFANDFNIVTREKGKYLQFSWVIDNAGYMGQHLHQVEEFQYKSGNLVPLFDKPILYVNDSWENATSGQHIESTQQATEFLEENNQPRFAYMVKNPEKFFPSEKKPNTTVKRAAPQAARPSP